jgi:signal transduction histidine kinase
LLAVSHDAVPINRESSPVLAGNATIYLVDSTSYFGVPLVTKAGLVGVITLAASPQRKYTQADLDLAEDLGRRAALAIENANLYKRAQEAVRGRDEFLSIASHELRGPIMSLHLAVQMLGKGQIPSPISSPRPSRSSACRIDDSRSSSTSCSIRAGSDRRLRMEFEHVDLAEVVRNGRTSSPESLPDPDRSSTFTTEGPVGGEWDRFRVDQIVTNLLSNAIARAWKPIEIHVTARAGCADPP